MAGGGPGEGAGGRVGLLPEALARAGGRVVGLPAPGGGDRGAFAVGERPPAAGGGGAGAGAGLWEIQWHRERHRAWLLAGGGAGAGGGGGWAERDGGVLLISPCDPLFLALPALEAARGGAGGSGGPGVFCPLAQALGDFAGGELQCLEPLLSPATLRLVCDAREAGGDTYYRLSDARVLAWLRVKARGVAKAGCAGVPGLAALDEAGRLAYAAGLLGEYLSPEWARRLGATLGVPLAAAPHPPAAAAGVRGAGEGSFFEEHREAGEKRARVDKKELAREAARRDREEKRRKERQREAKTMHSLSALFGRAQAKKPK